MTECFANEFVVYLVLALDECEESSGPPEDARWRAGSVSQQVGSRDLSLPRSSLWSGSFMVPSHASASCNSTRLISDIWKGYFKVPDAVTRVVQG